MPRVRRGKKVEPPAHWEIHDEYRIEGRHPLIYGREFKVQGEYGRMRFIRAVTNTKLDVTWIDCYDREGRTRTFDPARVVRVHSGTVRMRANHVE